MARKIAAHHKTTRGSIGGFAAQQDRERDAARRVRFGRADAEYRKALRLAAGDPLPGRIGSCGRGGGRPVPRLTRRACGR